MGLSLSVLYCHFLLYEVGTTFFLVAVYDFNCFL